MRIKMTWFFERYSWWSFGVDLWGEKDAVYFDVSFLWGNASIGIERRP